MVRRVRGGAARKKKFDDVHATASGRDVQRRRAFVVARVHVGEHRVREVTQHGRVARGGGEVRRRRPGRRVKERRSSRALRRRRSSRALRALRTLRALRIFSRRPRVGAGLEDAIPPREIPQRLQHVHATTFRGEVERRRASRATREVRSRAVFLHERANERRASRARGVMRHGLARRVPRVRVESLRLDESSRDG